MAVENRPHLQVTCEGRLERELQPRWDIYLEAETAIIWSWPAIDWAFLVNENQAASFGT